MNLAVAEPWTPRSVMTAGSCFVVVSGYAPVPSAVVVRDGVRVAVSDLHAITWTPTSPTRRFRRCGCCRRVSWEADALADGRLGWLGYCRPCVTPHAAACFRAHRRLPRLGAEFYCPKCERIQPVDLQELHDWHPRMECRPCHLARKQAEYQRRQAARG